MQVPLTFPDMRALGHYCNPVISTDAQLRDLRDLKNGWDPKIDQNKLRVLLRSRFNIWTRGYMKHIAPIFMVRQLARCSREDTNLIANTTFDIQLKRTIKKKSGNGDDSEEPTELERKITFYPLPAVEIDLREPEGEDWSIWEGKDGSHYDPAGRVESNILDCFLKHGLPERYLTSPEPPKRQRKQKATIAAPDSAEASASVPSINAEAAAPKSAPKKRGRPKKDATAAADDVEAISSEGVPQAPQKRGRPKKDANAPTPNPSSKRKKPSKDDVVPTPPPAVFRLPRGSSFTISANSSQSNQDPISLEDDEPRASISQVFPTPKTMPTFNRATSFATELHSPVPPTTPITPTALVLGEATSPATIRALRAATWSFSAAKTTATATPPTAAAQTAARIAPSRGVSAGAEVIDLTD
jgi:hypothetical protein